MIPAVPGYLVVHNNVWHLSILSWYLVLKNLGSLVLSYVVVHHNVWYQSIIIIMVLDIWVLWYLLVHQNVRCLMSSVTIMIMVLGHLLWLPARQSSWDLSRRKANHCFPRKEQSSKEKTRKSWNTWNMKHKNMKNMNFGTLIFSGVSLKTNVSPWCWHCEDYKQVVPEFRGERCSSRRSPSQVRQTSLVLYIMLYMSRQTSLMLYVML